MNDADMKCVMVLDAELPGGLLANTCAILGMTLGKLLPEQVGEDVIDASGNSHPGITTIPISMLKAERETIHEIRERLYSEEFRELTVADFSDIPQKCATYDVYTEKAARTPTSEHKYYGVAIYGHKKKVNRLTGAMPLLR